MTAFVLVRLATAGALLAAAANPALAQAPSKPWKHGIIAPKADAGFLLMAAKRGFAEKEGLKLGQGRPDRAQGAAVRRARQLRGRRPGRDRGQRARRRREDHGLPL